jgi:hypothetical protein
MLPCPAEDAGGFMQMCCQLMVALWAVCWPGEPLQQVKGLFLLQALQKSRLSCGKSHKDVDHLNTLPSVTARQGAPCIHGTACQHVHHMHISPKSEWSASSHRAKVLPDAYRKCSRRNALLVLLLQDPTQEPTQAVCT